MLAPPSGAALPRATADRPDDQPGAQIHFVYAVPSDQADNSLDTDGTLDGAIAGLQGWLRGQTGGPGLRIDTYQGQPDITFVRLPKPDTAYESGLAIVSDLGPLASEQDKALAIFYEGSYPDPAPGIAICGLGSSIGTPRSVVFLHDSCRFDLASSKAGAFLALERVMLHELLHAMGLVPSCAPHYDGTGHVNDSPADMMAPFLNLDQVPILDVNHDDYFHAGIPNCLDLSNSRFLEGAGFDLNVTIVGAGGGLGSVQGRATDSAANDFLCSSTCTTSYDSGAAVGLELTAEPAPGSVFVGWQGACTGKAGCELSLSQSQSVTAVFGKPPPPAPLAVSVVGRGRVTSRPAEIACPGRCTGTFVLKSVVHLTAVAAKGWRFAGWTGSCSGRGGCSYVATRAARVRATFTR